MTDKKKTYEYGLYDVPPFGHLLINAFQHILLMFVAIGFPVIFSSQINASPEFTASLITFSMLAAGIGTIVQCIGFRFIGSGYICPNVCGPSYVSLSLQAAWMGGIPLMRGLIIAAGLIEMAIAPIVQKLRKVFPTFIIGLVVAMVGISIIKMSISSLFGVSFWGDAIRSTDIIIGMFSALIRMSSLSIRLPTSGVCGSVSGAQCRPTRKALRQSPLSCRPPTSAAQSCGVLDLQAG